MTNLHRKLNCRSAGILLGAGVLLGATLAFPACEGMTDGSPTEPGSDDLRATTSALTTLPNNWDATCGDVSVTRSPRTIYVAPAPSGNDSAAGTLAAPLASLDGAQKRIAANGDLATRDYFVVVRGGEYRAQVVTWNTFATGAHIHIKAMDGETPVFNGAKAGETIARRQIFFEFDPPSATTKTNLTIEGLTVRNYVQIGFHVRAMCNRVYNNRLDTMGDAYANCVGPVSGTSHKTIEGAPGPGCADGSHPGECCPSEIPTTGCWCTGFGAIDLQGGSHNLLKHNDIVHFDGQADPGKLHAFYIAADGNHAASTLNRIEDNYVGRSVASGVKVKENSIDNLFINNYFERIAYNCFADVDLDTPSFHTQATGNVCTFWYNTLDKPETYRLKTLASPSGSTTLSTTGPEFYFGTLQGTHPDETGTADAQQSTGSYFQPANDPASSSSMVATEVVTASVAADVVGDSKPEIFVALYYPSLHYTKVVYSDGGKGELRTVAYTSTDWRVNALTKIRPAGATKDQVVGAFYLSTNDLTQVWVGAPTSDGRYGLNAGTKLLNSLGASGWKVSALTAGKFGNDAADTLITAAVINGVQEIWRGDGHTAQSGTSIPGVAGTRLYSNEKWRVTALTNGVISGSTSSLITAFHWVASSTLLNRIYTGDGVGGASSVQILPDSTKVITALTVGKLGGSTPRLVSAFDDAGTGQVYLWTGTTIGASPVYSNQFWDVTSLAAGAVDATSNDQLITSFDQPGKTEVHWADGTSSATSGGLLYAFP
jgi:hypothetical protein